MKTTRHSSTAEATAAVRAWHRLNHEPVIFDDPFAIEFTSNLWRIICNNRLLTWLIFEKILKHLQPIASEIICRARYTEDKLEQAIINGLKQYVLLGAGFDSFVLRRPDLIKQIYMYEVDHPLSQTVKIQRIEKNYDISIYNIEYLPVDFEKETLVTALNNSSYSLDIPAFVSWLGVVQYLPRESVSATLVSLASITAPGSELVFDYLVPEELLSNNDKQILKGLMRFTERRGEPLFSSFEPADMEQEIKRSGFEIIENLSPAGQTLRYFDGSPNSFRPFGGYYVMHVRRIAG